MRSVYRVGSRLAYRSLEGWTKARVWKLGFDAGGHFVAVIEDGDERGSTTIHQQNTHLIVSVWFKSNGQALI